LDYLNCSGNKLNELDVNSNSLLTYLDCSENTELFSSEYYSYMGDYGNDSSSKTGYLTSLNINGATALTYLDCSGNALDALDASSNSLLTYLDCSENA